MIKIIAEAGINHCGKWERALDLADAAKEAGADAVKFQLYYADRMVADHPQRDFLKQYELTDAAHYAVKKHCDEIGIEWMVSCFDEEAVKTACEIGCYTIKVGSGEIVNDRLLACIGERKKDIIISTGMATMQEIRDACMQYRSARATHPNAYPITLLHCTSAYPAPYDQLNMRAITTLKREFGMDVGYSDHSGLVGTPIMAVALGATTIECHIKVDDDCPDKQVSIGPGSFKFYVEIVRRAYESMGDGVKRAQPCEMEMLKTARYRWHKKGEWRP